MADTHGSVFGLGVGSGTHKKITSFRENLYSKKPLAKRGFFCKVRKPKTDKCILKK